MIERPTDGRLLIVRRHGGVLCLPAHRTAADSLSKYTSIPLAPSSSSTRDQGSNASFAPVDCHMAHTQELSQQEGRDLSFALSTG